MELDLSQNQHLAYKAKSKRRRDPRDDLLFDSDSYQIMVDNGASYSISYNIDDFIEPSYRHQHHFGCPVYVLNKDIQDGRKPGNG